MANKYKDTTMSVGIVSGGTADNIVPCSCEMVFDLRSICFERQALQDVKNYIDKLKKQYPKSEIKLVNKLEILGFSQPEDELIKQFKSELVLSTEQFRGGCEAGYLQKLGGDVIVFGAGKLSLAHNKNEYLDIKKYEKYNKMLMKMVKIVEKNAKTI